MQCDGMKLRRALQASSITLQVRGGRDRILYTDLGGIGKLMYQAVEPGYGSKQYTRMFSYSPDGT